MPSEALSLDPITSRLAGIEEQLGANRDITIELATKAAEEAVKMSVEAMPQMAASGVPMDSAALNSMSDILAQLNHETQHNNSKSVEAFGAVTQTLNLMVERLGSIEEGLSSKANPAVLEQPETPVQPIQHFVEQAKEDLPKNEAAFEEFIEEPKVQSRNPAEDLVKAARSAAETEKTLPEVPHTMALKEPILDTMNETQHPVIAEEVEKNTPLPEVETPNMAIETMPEVNEEKLPESGPDARRAAQAAAQEAGAVEEEIEEKTKKSLFASLPELFAKRKKVIIMAAAAALFIAVAGAVVPKFLGGNSKLGKC